MADKDNIIAILMVMAFILFVLALGFLIVAGIVYIGSLMFHYEFSWPLVLGCYSILVLLKIWFG